MKLRLKLSCQPSVVHKVRPGARATKKREVAASSPLAVLLAFGIGRMRMSGVRTARSDSLLALDWLALPQILREQGAGPVSVQRLKHSRCMTRNHSWL
eukprot:365725-Chlamydomonas_euryale.AAC.14